MITLDNIKKIIPEYPKLSGREDFTRTAVVVVLLKDKDDWKVIFEKRAHNISQAGEISFAGGKFDERFDKTPKDTAIRETVEELGIDKKDIEVLGELDTLAAPIGAIIQPFVAISNITESSINYNKNEVEYIFSVPLKWFLDNKPKEYQTILKAHPTTIDKDGKEITLLPVKELGLPERYNKPWGRLKQKVYVYNYKNEIIWGLTAKIMHSFINNLIKN